MRNPYIKRLSRRLRGRWRAKSLGEHAIAIVAETKNGRLSVHAGDFNVSRSLLENGEYDWQQITWLKQLLDAKSRVIFAGAHIGAVLIPVARISGTRSLRLRAESAQLSAADYESRAEWHRNSDDRQYCVGRSSRTNPVYRK